MKKTNNNIKIMPLPILFIIFSLLIGLNMFTLVTKYVAAFTIKAPGDRLTADNDWDILLNDFVNRDGDTMTGNLVIAGDADGARLCINGACRDNWSTILGGECVRRRSTSHNSDSVQYCDASHPRLISCFLVDDQVESLTGDWGATNLSTICPGSGFCDANNGSLVERTGLGMDNAYLETVNNGGREGCWQYDQFHSRADYKLELLCCRTS